MKAGDVVTTKELEEAGWKYDIYVAGGIFAFTKDEEVIFWEESTGSILFIMEVSAK